ncbi:PREDICTED: uncharacterized protein LOC107341638 isoform X3 [Acropora digitifera]|uniref:uncharacterized protein LOC107341638 isoform X3 n=1 Tax=Acropora digitifera TaxID=70779 RepID=UPI00077A8242|nr:PREDICTED: uncharacterized protein LOC107341638 isoform X3 [Acropora digitifera]
MSLRRFAEGSPSIRRDLLKVVLLCCTVEKVFCRTVLWPLGQYGLPMPKSNCPTANGFVWKRGNIYQDLEDSSNQTRISPQSHLQAIIQNSTNVIRYFCMKIDNSTSHDAKRKKWPKGEYCIYQKGSSCPAGMISGSLLWDDENGVNGSKNFRNGTLPKGVYNHDTKIFFCCQISGSYNVPIELPTDKPFYLIAFRPHCQEVLNTGHIMEFIEYATEDHNNHDNKSFPYPYGAEFRNPRIHYCYYYYEESTPFTITPSSTTTVEISTTDSTDQPRITGEAEPTDENIVRAARKQQDKTKAVPSYVIPVVFSLLVLMAGVMVLIHYHRKRRRNKIKIEDPGRLSVIYSTVDMKQEINRNNNLLNTGDIIIGNKTTLNRDFQGGYVICLF